MPPVYFQTVMYKDSSFPTSMISIIVIDGRHFDSDEKKYQMILNLHFWAIVIIHKENIFPLANIFSFLLPHSLAAIIIFVFHEFDLLKFSHISITTEHLPQCICHILLSMLYSNLSMLSQMSNFPHFLKVNYISQ